MSADEFQEKSIEAVKVMWHLYLLERTPGDIAASFAGIPENMMVVGTGHHEFYRNKQEYIESITDNQIVGREIQLARQSGIYSEVKEGERFEYPAAKDPFFSCQRFTITRKDGGQEDSVLCLGARNSKFVKIRIAFSPPSASSVAVAEGLLMQIARMTNF